MKVLVTRHRFQVGWEELHQGTLSGISASLPLPTPHTMPHWILWGVSQEPHCSVRGTPQREEGGKCAERGSLGHRRVEEVDWLYQLSVLATELQIPHPDPNPRRPPSFTKPFLHPPPHLLPFPPMQMSCCLPSPFPALRSTAPT